MNWLEEWAKLKVIGMWVGIGFVALIVLAVFAWILVHFIKEAYKSRSKKCEWDCVQNKWVRKEDSDNGKKG